MIVPLFARETKRKTRSPKKDTPTCLKLILDPASNSFANLLCSMFIGRQKTCSWLPSIAPSSAHTADSACSISRIQLSLTTLVDLPFPACAAQCPKLIGQEEQHVLDPGNTFWSRSRCLCAFRRPLESAKLAQVVQPPEPVCKS